MATATLFGPNQENSPASIERNIDGSQGASLRFFVDSQSPTEIFSATGLPRLGDPFSVDFPGLIARKMRTDEYVGSTSCYVLVEYSSLSGGRIDPIGGKGNDWTELVGQPSQFTARTGIGVDNTKLLDNGRGRSKEIFQVEARVHAFLTLAEYQTVYGRVLDLADGAVNSDQLQLPRMDGTSLFLTIDPGQARYVAPQVVGQYSDGVIEFIHILALRPNHIAEWEIEGPDGLPTGAFNQAKFYDERPFAGLWSL